MGSEHARDAGPALRTADPAEPAPLAAPIATALPATVPGLVHGDPGRRAAAVPSPPPGAPVIRRAIATAKEFSKLTDEGPLTREGSSQKAITPLLTKYHAQFVRPGRLGVDKAKLPEALSVLHELQDLVNWWIDDHRVDVDNGLGGVATIDDPSRRKRMAGMRTFRKQVESEISTLQSHQRKKGAEVTVEIDQPSPGYLKMQQKKAEGAQSVFARLGVVADQIAGVDGDTSEIEIFLQFPVDPSGIGFIGGRLKGTVSREDGFVKVAIELALTGGGKIADNVSLSGELGGYFTAQAKTGEDAFLAISYGFYRRMMESAVIPAEVSSFVWGGAQANRYGKGKADQWSLQAERKLWGNAKDASAGDKTYIETGGQASGRLNAKAGIGSAGLSSELLGSYKEGRRVDYTSLKNRKGGAGEKNLPSDSVLAQGSRFLSGGTRGAEKHTSRSVRSLQVAATVGVDVPMVATVSGKGEFKLELMNDGKRATLGETSKTTATSAELKSTFAAGLKLRELTGPFVSRLIQRSAVVLTDALRTKMKVIQEEDPSAAQVLVGLGNDLESLLSQTVQLEKLVETALAEQVKAATGQALKAMSSVGATVIITVDPIKDKASIEIKLEDLTSLEIPTLLKAKLKRQKRVVRFACAKGVWSTQ